MNQPGSEFAADACLHCYDMVADESNEPNQKESSDEAVDGPGEVT